MKKRLDRNVKRIFLELDEEHQTMLSQLVSLAKEKNPKASRSSVLRDLIKQEWMSRAAEHRMDVRNRSIYFLTSDQKIMMKEQLEQYQSEGLVIDDQLIYYMASKFDGFVV